MTPCRSKTIEDQNTTSCLTQLLLAWLGYPPAWVVVQAVPANRQQAWQRLLASALQLQYIEASLLIPSDRSGEP